MTIESTSIVFNLTPIPKPRMTQSDKWNERPAVVNYYAYKQKLRLDANTKKYRLSDTLCIDFFIPMPKSWSDKKRQQMIDKPHQDKPDIDNLVKGFMDALSDADQNIWLVSAQKHWSDTGYIVVTLEG